MDLTPPAEKGPAFDAIEILRDPSHVHALTPAELRGIGADLGLVEIAVRPYEVRMPLEAVLKTSFPEASMLERVRFLYRADALSGADALGMSGRIESDQITVAYPLNLVVWKRPVHGSPDAARETLA